MEMQSPPPQDSFELVKWLWAMLTLPIAWVMHRQAETREDISTIRADQTVVKEDMAGMKAHMEHSQSDIKRIVLVLDRMEKRMDERRRGDSR